MSESSYSYSLTTFSPSGKLIQIEHALEAVNKGNSTLGIKGFFLFDIHILFYLIK
jgi:20S proteasome subunit alpha 2